MIKLFSLNHTRIRRSSILAQDKTHISTSRCLDICCQMVSASAHTNYLVNLLKSVERLLNQGRVFYITAPPCQRLFSMFFSTRRSDKQKKNQNNLNRLPRSPVPPYRRSLSKWGAFYRHHVSCQRPLPIFFQIFGLPLVFRLLSDHSVDKSFNQSSPGSSAQH